MNTASLHWNLCDCLNSETIRIENVRTFLGRAKLLMDTYLLHSNKEMVPITGRASSFLAFLEFSKTK